MSKPTSVREQMASFCAGDRYSGRTPYQQNNSLKNEGCASGPKAGNSATAKLSGFYGCLLVVIGNGADRPKKKGRISSPTLWLVGKAGILALAYSDSLGFLRCRRLISPFTAVTINCAFVSPSSRLLSNSATTSCGNLALSCCDLLLVEPVAITGSPCVRCDSVYAKKRVIKDLKCDSLGGNFKKQGAIHLVGAKPGSGGTLTGPLTTTVNASNEAAMKDHTTHPQGRNNYTWRFLALNRHDKKATPCRLSVEAETERESRRILAPHFILSLAARLPVVEVRHV
nr:MAG TPA: hypothetical protein [Caudoviricetes sp.]